MKAPRWTVIQQSEYPWEREALEYVRELLPDTEPFRAWSNFEFIAQDGSINEVDLLVFSLYRIFLVEIKSAPGIVQGDPGTWVWSDGGNVRRMDNPLLLANRKAKKLKSLLGAQHTFKGKGPRVPYIEAVVFLSHPEIRCELTGTARTGIVLRKEARRGDVPHVAEVLSGDRDLYGGGTVKTSRIDHVQAKAVARALDQSGIRPAQRERKVGDYTLEELITETDVYQDWAAKHVQIESSTRRVRLYPVPVDAPEAVRIERRKAAEREYRLLDGVVHEGILRAENFTEHERGPALFFEHPPGAERLDFFLQQRLTLFDQRQRLVLVRQLAEALQFAHSRRLYHQALTPQSILVINPESESPSLKIFNWQAGFSDSTGEGGSRLTVNQIVRVGLAGEEQGTVYLAPELYFVGPLDSGGQDVFSLGAIAYHILTGQAPATSIEELHDRLTRGKDGLRLSQVLDGVSEPLEDLVAWATGVETSERLDVSEFVGFLDEVIAEVTAPKADFVHPLDANPGDELEGGFVVRQRLGKGSTALALYVERDSKEGVLKVALEPALNDRIYQEGEVLDGLRHQNVAELLDTVEVSGHAALFIEAAGTPDSEGRLVRFTLAQRIREEGRLSLDMLQRFGEELLGVVDYIEQKGISHRDIKPDNVGIGQTPKKKLTLVLFDFSLSGVPADNIRAGTPPYLDPFLSLRKPPRWDPYAERFAAAVTLYEMATGQLPTWGDGQTNPALIEDEVTLDVELLDQNVREGLERFFRKALARKHKDRFDNAEEMRRAWARIFEQIDEPTRTTDTEDVDLSEILAGATESTAVVSLPLSPRVLNALERMDGVDTLGDLLEMPRIRLYRNKGIGQRTVRDIRRLAEQVAEHFAGKEATNKGVAEVDASVDVQRWSIELMYRRLVPRSASDDDQEIVRGMLGMIALGGQTASWPSQQEVAEGLGHSRDSVRAVIERERERWRKDNPNWSLHLRNDIEQILKKHGGVLTHAELVASLLAVRGSTAPEADRARHAFAVAFAAVEIESSLAGARYTLYRGSHRTFVVATPLLDQAYVASPAARGRYAEALGEKADELAEADPLLSHERAIEELIAIEQPEGEPPLPSERVMRLSAAASQGAALSSRHEIYPHGMTALRALKLGANSLLGTKKLPVDMAQARIASRYPDAEPLPGRPALDTLLEEVGLHLRWDPDEEAYRPPDPRGVLPSSTSELTRYSTTGQPDLDSPEVVEALTLEQKLKAAVSHGRLLVLTVSASQYGQAAGELASRFDLVQINLESLVLRAMREAAQRADVNWEVVLAADAADHTSRDWRNLKRLADQAVTSVETELMGRDAPALLVYPGLLARYDKLDLLDRLRDACDAGRAPGFLLLVPADAQATMPVIDRVPLPVVHASDWSRVPMAWLRNQHRGRTRASEPVT